MNSEIKMVTITEENLKQLIDERLFLEALEEAGVDSWEGYSEAVEIYREKIA